MSVKPWNGVGQNQRVRIATVDPTSRKVEAVTKDGAIIQIAVWGQPTIFRWPEVGETWIVTRMSGYWILVEPVQREIEETHPIDSLNAGDVNITTGTGGRFLVNGSAVAGSQPFCSVYLHHDSSIDRILYDGSAGISQLTPVPFDRVKVNQGGVFTLETGVDLSEFGLPPTSHIGSVIRVGADGYYRVGLGGYYLYTVPVPGDAPTSGTIRRTARVEFDVICDVAGGTATPPTTGDRTIATHVREHFGQYIGGSWHDVSATEEYFDSVVSPPAWMKAGDAVYLWVTIGSITDFRVEAGDGPTPAADFKGGDWALNMWVQQLAAA